MSPPQAFNEQRLAYHTGPAISIKAHSDHNKYRQHPSSQHVYTPLYQDQLGPISLFYSHLVSDLKQNNLFNGSDFPVKIDFVFCTLIQYQRK